jgi:hypothetical protein
VSDRFKISKKRDIKHQRAVKIDSIKGKVIEACIASFVRLNSRTVNVRLKFVELNAVHT